MNDRFKFRVWDKENEVWVDEEDCSIAPNGELTVLGLDSYGETNFCKTDDCIIEQCTGLKDKNGKLIYEGDIVKCRYYDNFDGTERESIGKVYWHKEDSAFYIFISLEEEIGFYGNSIEVIGNIHEKESK